MAHAANHSCRTETRAISPVLRSALWGSPLLTVGAWLIQWRWRFPPRSMGASLTAKTLVLGTVLASISAIYRLARSPTARNAHTCALAGLNAIILLSVLLLGILLVFGNVN